MTEEYLVAAIRRLLQDAKKRNLSGEITLALGFNSGGLARGRITTHEELRQPPPQAPARMLAE